MIDVRTDPVAVYQYLASHRPKSLDFLLPHATHDNYPAWKQSFSDTPYGDWLISVFDYWFHLPENHTRIKYFNNIITLLIGGNSETESLGHPPVNIVTIEANGDIEGVDTLKVAFDGAPGLGIQKEPLLGVYIATTNMRYPKQRLEFMAKRLAEYHVPEGQSLGSKHKVIILGSPLYVAMAE